MAEPYPYTPVIRLPRSKSNTTRSNYAETYQYNGNGDSATYFVSDTLFLENFPGSKLNEMDIRELLKNCQPVEIQLRDRGDSFLRFAEPKLVYNGFTFTNGGKLQFRIYHDKQYEPEPQGTILHVRNLPLHMDNNALYDLFRPFGPLSLCKTIVEGGSFRGTALICYFYLEDSEEAQKNLNGTLMDGKTLNISTFMPDKTRSPNDHGKNNEKTEGSYVDYMNLYVKNLDPGITNTDLFNLFRKFGRIVSARVMSNPTTGQSKGYGFVSYGRAEEAGAALQEMNGAVVGSKQLIVAYHEPKKPRQEKQQPLASPAPYSIPAPVPSPQPTEFSTTPGTPYFTQHPHEMHNNSRSRSSQTNTDASIPDSAIGLGIENVDQIAISIKDLSIGQKQHPVHRKASAVEAHYHQTRLSPQFSSSPVSTGPSLASLASGLSIQPPPASVQQKIERPTLRRKGSLESVSSIMTESSAVIQRQKMMEAVMRCGDYGNIVDDVVDMLLTLKRKERSLCLFNQDFLKEKIRLAMEALDAFNDVADEDAGENEYAELPRAPMTASLASSAQTTTHMTPSIPAATVNAAPMMTLPPRENRAIPIVRPPAPQEQTTLSEQEQEIEMLLASIENKPVHEKKQLLGDRLFPLVKATGTKQAPKVTIRLLDTIDLRELAHIMYDKDELKERVQTAFAALK
ncbi:hypothetical protein EC973_002959 [Apophysomyces ossiformis]|uniref:Polyadenylate tail-binding protein n=1 Tax=Apophysomyces ossiformis TaxID=679940 RepID=A0A8H7ELD2_9FUNG|nr:hypothetical protein EC973_002959 [Apophysomyces ossiformis]